MTKGRWYWIAYRLQAGNYRWVDWESQMQYLGFNDARGEHEFSLRPLAGTQHLPHTAIVAFAECDPEPMLPRRRR